MSWFGWLLYQLRRHFLLATVSGSVVTLMMIACLVVAFLYVRSQSELTQLQLQLAEQSDVIATERMLFRSQLSRLQQREWGRTNSMLSDWQTMPTMSLNESDVSDQACHRIGQAVAQGITGAQPILC